MPGGMSKGKVYFDAVGDPPTSVVYNGAGGMVAWVESSAPPEEEEAPAEEAPAEEAPAEEAPAEEAPAEEAPAEEADGRGRRRRRLWCQCGRSGPGGGVVISGQF